MSKHAFFHIEQSTLAYDSCIGCAICETVCPHDAITMKKNSYIEIEPKINYDKCTKCTICVQYCPLERNKAESRAELISQDNPHHFGLQNSEFLLAWNSHNDERINSASGGAVSAIIEKMFQDNMIDAVIHAEAIPSFINELNFKSTISYSIEEAKNRKGSFYQSLDYTEVLHRLKNGSSNRYLLIAVPCIISGIKKLVTKHKDYKHIELYTIALACSHNVNPQFTSFMAESANIKHNQSFVANMRAKDISEVDANNFHTRFLTPSGKILFSQNRFGSLFTNTWRNYLFAKSACLKCTDFWGYEADLSVKDAWGKWSFEDVLGKSIVVVRNQIFNDLISKVDSLSVESLKFEEVAYSQAQTTQFKQAESLNKLYKSIYSKENRKNGLLFFTLASKLSKFVYRFFGFRLTLDVFKILKRVISISNQVKPKFGFVKKIVRFVPKFTHDKPYILVLGGYGYANVGDEAQLNITLKELGQKFPDYDLIVLTPNIDYTQNEHGCIAKAAPRVAFFDHDINDYYWLLNNEHKKIFIKNTIRIYLTALFDRLHLPISLIGDKKLSLLSMVKESSMIYFSGGGYLTGKTLSRLWDGTFFISLAKLYGKPVALSGQTIGLFRNWFDKLISKIAFSKADLITVRDAEDSLKDLRNIGVHGAHVYSTFDDALFCDKSDLQILKNHLTHINFDLPYVALQFHYWGISNQETKDSLLLNIKKLVDYIFLATNYNIVLFGMHMSDLEPLNDFIHRYPDDRIAAVGDNRNFRDIRGVIANSEICITMKHHPIIFAVGEKIPLVSLAFDPYYVHKNKGALAVFCLEEFNIDISNGFNLELIINVIQKALNKKEKNANKIENKLLELKKVRIKFLDEVDLALRYKN